MPLTIYNTLTRKKELFETVESGKVRMYVCGPTVYDSCHIGHARSVVIFDVIARYLRATGYDVTYVRNFTDVDDKIINRANQMGVSSQDVAEKYIREFYEDMDALKVERATLEPRATGHIDDIIRIVSRLIEKGMAYSVDGDVYFAVEKFTDYGKLSGRKLEDMEAGARVDVDERKRNPFDFALWKASKPGEPEWDSPWGKGRPGWHIECSAMSSSLLGETIDIHGGGKDLIFPHHENEIAQSEAAFDKPFVRYWIHNGFINIESEKMSKSLGNFLLIRDVLKNTHPEAIRLFLLSSHYRSPIDFNDRVIEDASANLEKLYTLLIRTDSILDSPSRAPDRENGEWWLRFCDAMNDDFNTARGIGIVYEAARTMNRMMDEFPSDADKKTLSVHRCDLLKIGAVLGILTESPDHYFETEKQKKLNQSSIDPAIIEKLIQDRAEARKSRNWQQADAIRKQLEAMQVILEDRPEGTIWKMTS
ncbi:MAG: cysteine--tRNA ligase [Desulfatirhabdiaceae bacterium]